MLTGEQILELQTLVREVPVTDHVIHYTPGAGAADARRRAGRAEVRQATG